MKAARLLLLTPLIAAACGIGMGGGTSMTGQLNEMNRHVENLGSELQAHKASIAGINSVNEVSDLEGAHLGNVEEMIAKMGETSQMMHACTGSGGMALDVEKMHALADQMKQDCHHHQTAMVAAADLDAASAEESRHQAKMAVLQAQVTAQKAAIESSASSYSCMDAHRGGNGH